MINLFYYNCVYKYLYSEQIVMHYQIRPVQLTDIDRCYEIESKAYPEDEAATKEKIRIRAEQYPEGFLVLESQHNIIGFINSGCANQIEMSDENFKELIGHHADGSNIVIMSVVVDPEFQGQGYSSLLMNHFIAQSKSMSKTAIYLMCKEKYIQLYRKFGFEYLQVSESDHGGEIWYEMLLKL